MTKLEDLEGFRDAVLKNQVWIGTTAEARKHYDRAPALIELVELAIEALKARREGR